MLDLNSLTRKMVLKKKKNKKKNKNITLQVKEVDKRENYRIIITSQNKIMICVFKTMYKKSALSAFDKIIKENKKNIRFPVRYSSRDHKLMPSKYELLLMRTKNEDETQNPLLRNEYGQLVPHVSNSDKMVIYKKEEYLFEESFWVYGLNPKSQRVDFKYILNDMVLKDLKIVKYPIKTITIYRNKLIIQTDDDIDIIICKCEDDVVRLYTEIEKEINKLKIKSVLFTGIAKGVYNNRIEEKIIEKTGWDLYKIRRKSTRP